MTSAVAWYQNPLVIGIACVIVVVIIWQVIRLK